MSDVSSIHVDSSSEDETQSSQATSDDESENEADNDSIVQPTKRKMANRISSDSENDDDSEHSQTTSNHESENEGGSIIPDVKPKLKKIGESEIESSFDSNDRSCNVDQEEEEKESEVSEQETSNVSSNIEQEEHDSVEIHKRESSALQTTAPDMSYRVPGSASDSELEGSDAERSFQAAVEIPETDVDSDDSDVVIIDSENEDEADRMIESFCVSPRTRRSIHGFKPDDFEIDDSSDEDMFDSTKLTTQPKITNFATNQKPFIISQKEHDENIAKQKELLDKVSTFNKLLTLQSKLPDKGENIRKKLEETQQEIEIITKRLSNSKIDNKSFEIVEPKKKVNDLSWADIQKATEDVKPIFLGNQGIATFNRQKALTIDRLQDLHGSLADCPPDNARVDPPKALKISLMDHQIYGLAWMMWREKRKPRGGILADDMGLGKTLSMISLILKTLESEDGEIEENDSTDDESKNDDNDYNWKTKGRKDNYDGGTLVVCPASLINQWNEEINKHVKRNYLETCLHHGPKREKRSRHLAKYDVVITTYAIVSQEHKNKATVFGVNWNRVILDEAHVTRNYKSKMSEAVCDLTAKRRWALTGTPVQNKEMDVYSLLKFLKCSPFNDLAIYKKWIDNKSTGGQSRLNTVMQSILLRRTKLQLQQKGELNSLPEKKIEVIAVDLDPAEMNVYQRLMLYSKSIFAQYLQQKQERDGNYYNPIYTKSSDLKNTYSKVHEKFAKMHGGTTDGRINATAILSLLLRLRQICCHPGLIHGMLDPAENADVSMEDVVNLNLLEEMNKLKLNDVSAEANLNVSEDDSDNPIAKASAKIMLPSNPVFKFDRPSTKISRIMTLIKEKIQYTNDKAIIVSQWTSFLSIIASNLDILGIPYNQLNGTVPVHKRNDLVTELNKVHSGPKIMLLSLTAGGVGLNLIGANYLFLADLHWNPQLEAQAQDRIYRVGQKKPVTIYKFMCTDTVEQRIKLLQDRKLEIANSVLTGAKISGSKLTMEDLRTLFEL